MINLYLEGNHFYYRYFEKCSFRDELNLKMAHQQ